MRFVKIAAAQWIASARPSASAWLETSMTQCVSPAARIAANVACRSIASGVVRATACSAPPIDRRHRAEQAGRLARGLEQRAHEVGRRRLAVRAGDADRAQRRGRVAVQARGGGRHRGAHVVDDDLRHAEAERVVDDERGRAARDGVGGEVVAVAGEAAHAEEDRAGRRPGGCRRRAR